MCAPAQSCLPLCDLMDCSPLDSIHGIFPGKNTGAGCRFLPQGTLLTQGSNPHLLRLLHWQEDSLPLVPPVAIILLGIVYHLNQYGRLILQDHWTFMMSSPPLRTAKALNVDRTFLRQRIYSMYLLAGVYASLFMKMSCLLRQYLGYWFQGIESVTFFNFLEFPCLWHSRKGILAYLGFS